MSENPRGTLLYCGHNFLTLVEIGLTDQTKEGGTCPLPPLPVVTAQLCLNSQNKDKWHWHSENFLMWMKTYFTSCIKALCHISSESHSVWEVPSEMRASIKTISVLVFVCGLGIFHTNAAPMSDNFNKMVTTQTFYNIVFFFYLLKDFVVHAQG